VGTIAYTEAMSKEQFSEWGIRLALISVGILAGAVWVNYQPDAAGMVFWIALTVGLIAAAWLGIRRLRRGYVRKVPD